MTSKKHVARALPALPPRVDPELKPLLTAIKEVLEVQVGHRGEDLDKAVTFRDLTESGIANLGNINSVGTLIPITDVGSQTAPPEPVTLTAAATFTNVLLSWAGGFKHDLVAATEVYRSTSNSLATAGHIGSTSSFVYTDTVEPSSTHYYWIRFISPAGVPGPYNATAGTLAVTSSINDAIPDATINKAKINNLTVDMAQVTGTLTADKINAGFITAEMLDVDAINAAVISVDNNIEFSGTASGLHFGKTSLGDSQAGAFFGRAGSVTGFSVSSATSGIYADSQGTVALNNVRLYTGAAGSALEHDIVGTYTANLSPQSASITIIVVGGGAGSQNNAAGGFWTYRQRVGNAGNPSSIQFMTGLNGTGSVISTFTAAGGAAQGYSVSPNNGNYTGYAGRASSQAAGGAGGGPGGFASAGTRGSGGGGQGSTHLDLSTGGVQTYAKAGTTVSQLVTKPSNAQSVRMTVGAGGAGGYWNYTHPNPQSDNYEVITVAGYSGGDGFVSIADPNSGGIEVDLLSILTRLNAAGL